MIWSMIFGAICAALTDLEQRIKNRIGWWVSPRRFK